MHYSRAYSYRMATVAALTVFTTTACDTNGVNGPGDGGLTGLAFSRAITISELDSIIGEGPARVEVELRAGELVAREVEIETPDELTDDEKIESRITAIAASNGQGTADLALAGGFTVAFTSSTEFEGKDGEDLTLGEFVTYVEDELAAGREPVVEAKRPAASPPQNPGDASFTTSKLELDDDEDDGEDKLELNIDEDNLTVLTTPPPDAQLEVLGLIIDIDWTNGVTEVEQEDEDASNERKFKDIVAAVDVTGGTFTLQNGIVIRVIDRTEIKHSSHGLESLQAVSDAIDAGLRVRAKGKAVPDESDPSILVAVKVKFKLTDHISLETFIDAIESGPVRVEVSLLADQLVAREAEIESDDESNDEEEIESRITGISRSGNEGSVELSLGNGFTVDFDGSTDFEGPDGEDFTVDDFVAWVEAELAAGRRPAVEAKRPAPSTPQDPTDTDFLATELELDDDGGKDKIEINIDGDNLDVLTSPPPDAQLTILGLVIDIDVTNGITELELED